MPLSLRRYDAADWPNPHCHPECAYWEAVGQWRRDHPINLDDVATSAALLLILDGPDVPFHPAAVGSLLVDRAHDNQAI